MTKFRLCAVYCNVLSVQWFLLPLDGQLYSICRIIWLIMGKRRNFAYYSVRDAGTGKILSRSMCAPSLPIAIALGGPPPLQFLYNVTYLVTLSSHVPHSPSWILHQNVGSPESLLTVNGQSCATSSKRLAERLLWILGNGTHISDIHRQLKHRSTSPVQLFTYLLKRTQHRHTGTGTITISSTVKLFKCSST